MHDACVYLAHHELEAVEIGSMYAAMHSNGNHACFAT